MKKTILFSLAIIALFFVSLTINTNINNNSGSVDLKSALQSANAAIFVHDGTSLLGYYGVHVTPNQPVWYNVASVYITISESENYWEHQTSKYVRNSYKAACLSGGDEPCTSWDTVNSTIMDTETGQYTHRTQYFGVAGHDWRGIPVGM
jgi:hypothetical protein